MKWIISAKILTRNNDVMVVIMNRNPDSSRSERQKKTKKYEKVVGCNE